jgi:LmbE family N-acetylglucosaminyl deacetylase
MMNLHSKTAEIFVPDGLAAEAALTRTTHMAVGAHQDDLEIMAFDGIIKCFQQSDRWFAGVVMTNGAGSPRADLYGDYTDEAMQMVRRKEQKKAATIGEYGAQVLLDYSSSVLKDSADKAPVEDLLALFELAQPKIVYTHNLADKHDTHVAVTLRVIEALRRLPAETRPKHLYGCEVWRNLDWMLDTDKITFDVSAHGGLQNALLGVFDSQVCGGKRYDVATMGRRQANATYFASHDTDVAMEMIFAMDLTPLIVDLTLSVVNYTQSFITRLAQEVSARISKFGGQ